MDPVIVHIRRGKSAVLAAMFAILALFFILFTAYALWILRTFDMVMVLCFLGTAGFTWATIFFIGVALKSPTALRMDTRGISGFYADPATWAEIASIDSFSDSKGYNFLGFTLHDPVAFRDRQTPWRRWKSYASERGTGYHIIVPEALLDNATTENLAQRARAFHAAQVQ